MPKNGDSREGTYREQPQVYLPKIYARERRKQRRHIQRTTTTISTENVDRQVILAHLQGPEPDRNSVLITSFHPY